MKVTASALALAGAAQHVAAQSANHIFNSLQDSMRQFGASLHHNGMSVFVATVPEDVEFYHGTSSQYRVNGTEWLAFEPEHALNFARSGGPGGGPGGPGGPGRGGPGRGPPPAGSSGPLMHHDGRRGGPRWPKLLSPGDHPHRGDGEHHGPPPPFPPFFDEDQEDEEDEMEYHQGLRRHVERDEHEEREHPRDWTPHHDDEDVPWAREGGERKHKDRGRDGPSRHDGKDFKGGRKHHGDRKDRDFDFPEQRKDHKDHDFDSPEQHKEHKEHKDRQFGPPEHHKDDKDRKDHGDRSGAERKGDKSHVDIMVEQKPILTDEPEEVRHGYLHTYRTKHPLRLLYVDGQSAAKSAKGTLDTQDFVLLHNAPPYDALAKDEDRRQSTKNDNKSPVKHHGPMGEGERAVNFCEIAKKEYDGQIDGLLRMEGGFEIILCDFAKHLDVVQIAQADSKSSGPGGNGDNQLNYFAAVAARYNDIGGDRVEVDYSDFVSLYTYPGAVYFDDNGLPRVNNVSYIIEPIRADIQALATSTKPVTGNRNWQKVADMVVARYANRIEYLASGDITTLDDFHAEAMRAIRPFIDYAQRNATAEIDRCAHQFLPSSARLTPTLASDAILNVTTLLCHTLSSASRIDSVAHGVSMLRGLKTWLNWAQFKKCHGCGPHEICFLPIWPSGGAEDFEHPTCRSDLSTTGRGYWGGFGPRGGREAEGQGYEEMRRGPYES